MASGFYQLPAPEIRNALVDFSPVNKAIDNWHKADQFNALLGMRQKADDRAAEEHDWQREKQQQATADRKSKALGAAAQSLLSMPPEQRGRAMQAWRMADKDFDGDLRSAGFNPDDVDTWGPMVVAKARGVQNPLDIEKTRADIDYTRARSDYFRGGGRSAASSSSADERIAERYMSENPDLTYMDALDLARTRPADRTRREGLAARNARDGLAPEEVEPWRNRYGVGPTAQPRHPASPNAPAGANRFDFSGSMSQQQNDNRRRQFLDEARRIRAQGAKPEDILRRLQQHGITASESDF